MLQNLLPTPLCCYQNTQKVVSKYQIRISQKPNKSSRQYKKNDQGMNRDIHIGLQWGSGKKTYRKIQRTLLWVIKWFTINYDTCININLIVSVLKFLCMNDKFQLSMLCKISNRWKQLLQRIFNVTYERHVICEHFRLEM